MIGGVKARWMSPCERCKTPITVGASYVVLHGRRWHARCAVDYLTARQVIHATTSAQGFISAK
jgi:hypothetical protein